MKKTEFSAKYIPPHLQSSNPITAATVTESCDPGHYVPCVYLDDLDTLLKQVLSSSSSVMSITSSNS